MPLPKQGAYIFVFWLLSSFSGLAQYSPKQLLAESDALFEQGAYADAMKGYAQLLSLEPTNSLYSYRYGATALYGDPSKREEAIKYLRFASKKPGVEPLVWYFLGRAYHLNYQFADAIAAYEKFRDSASRKEAEQWQIEQVIRTALNGQDLLSQIKDVTVLDKKRTTEDEFFRIYDLADIGGRILVTPDDLLSSIDQKRGHKSLIHFRGDGTTVYFSSYGKDGKNGLDIYAADVLPGGSFSEPRRLPETINTPYDEDFPYMHPDGRTLYFSSKGHTSMGGYDIFRASYDRSTGAFGAPQNMDFAINTPDDDIFYIADSLNKRANFASGRNSRQGELHVYRVEVDMQPLALTLVKGTFDNQIKPAQRTAKITIVDAATNKKQEVQYTDPSNGDYLLSFPKSGKYKLLVEAQGSDRVHTGIVDVPPSDGLTAYLQEMELVIPSGVEKLIINNQFDQTYDGDVVALAREMLRRRAALEVNFDASAVEEGVVAEISDEAEMDVSKAYNAAGFGAGMSNAQVLDNAEKRLVARQKQVDELRKEAKVAAFEAEAALALAKTYMDQAAGLRDKGNDSLEEGELDFEIAVNQWRADQSIERARVAQELQATLDAKSNELERKLTEEEDEVAELKGAINSGNYDKALSALRDENERLKQADKIAGRDDMLREMGKMNTAANEELKRFNDRAISMRNETDALVASRVTKRRQLENAKGKAAKQIEEDLQRLDMEIVDMEAATNKAFAVATDKNKRAKQLREQLVLLQGIKSGDYLADEAFMPQRASETLDKVEAIAANVAGLSVDADLVAVYIAAHPEALSAIGNQSALRDFQNATGVNVEVSDEILMALNQGSTTGQKPDGRPQPGTTPAAEKAKEANEKSPEDKAAPYPDQEPNDTSLTALKSDGNAKGVNRADGVRPMPTSPTSPTSPKTALQVESMDVDELKQRLVDADNWMEVLNESIAELKEGPAADSEDVAVQIEEFEKLRKAKADEMAAYQERLAVLSAAVEEPVLADEPGYFAEESEPVYADADMDSVQQEEDKRELPQNPVEETIAELARLDPSLVSRLESKINEASSNPSFVDDLSLVSPDYIPDLEDIELSGKSAPEIAAERITLNESFIQTITQFENELKEDSEVRERLIELRRIKALEIVEDRGVLEGKAEMIPRTTAALNYKKMLDEGDLVEKGVDEKRGAIEKRAIWSPAIEASLKKPYSWDDVVPGYIDLVDQDVDETTDASFLQQRIDGHQQLMSHLEDEIAIYSILVNDPKAASDIRIKQRFEQLDLERSSVVEMLENDRKLLKSKKAAIAMLPSGPPAEAEEALRGDLAGREDSAGGSGVRELEIPDNEAYMSEVLGRVEAAYTRFSEEPIKDPQGLESLAELNRKEAGSINDRIDMLTEMLDDAVHDADRDILQVQIQALDNLLADRLQEADRLEAEAESLLAAATSREPTEEGTTSESTELPVEDLFELEDVQLASSMPIQLNDFQYRSLEANMSGSKLNQRVEASNSLRSQVIILAEAYRTADTKDERLAVYEEYTQLSQELKRADIALNEAITKANEAETRFYLQSSKAVLTEVLGQDITPGQRSTAENMEKRRAEIGRELDINRELRQELDTYETAAHSNLLKQEMVLIEELDALLTSAKAIQQEEVSQVPSATTEDTDAINDQYVDGAFAESVGPNGDEPAEEISQEEVLGEKPLESSAHVERSRELLEIAPRDPQVHAPIPGRRYLTPALKQAAATTTQVERDGFSGLNPALAVRLAPLGASSMESSEMIGVHSSLKGADPEVLNEVLSSPKEERFLALLIAADTLKSLEKVHESELSLSYAKARESSEEAVRLRSAMALESNSSNRATIEERAKRLEAQSIRAYKRAAYAAQRGDLIRDMRKDTDAELARAASGLKDSQKNRVQSLLSIPPYSIIPSDLASTTERPAPKLQTRPAEAPKRISDDIRADALPDSEPVVASEPVETPEALEKTKAAASGYWLSMVEIIADKDDFSDVSDNMFVIADKEVYTADKPIPMDPVMPSGLIFQVQIGAFRNPIPQSLFGTIAPIMGQKLDNGITRYRAGLFKSYRTAIEARDEVRALGYSDAFVVAYVDGEKLTPEQARSMVEQAKTLLADQAAPLQESPVSADFPIASEGEEPIPTPEQPASYYDDPEAAEAVQVEVVRGLFYTVQVGVYSKPVKLDQLFNLSDLNSELTSGGLIRYTTGRYRSVGAASDGKAQAVAAGVSDAFVTAYYNGSRISLNEAASILINEGPEVLNIRTSAPDADVSGPTFVVVIAQFTGDVSSEVAEALLGLDGVALQLVQGQEGERYYISQGFEDRSQADALLSQIRRGGLSAAYVAAFADGVIRPLR